MFPNYVGAFPAFPLLYFDLFLKWAARPNNELKL